MSNKTLQLNFVSVPLPPFEEDILPPSVTTLSGAYVYELSFVPMLAPSLSLSHYTFHLVLIAPHISTSCTTLS